MVTSTRRTLQKPHPRSSLPPSARAAILTRISRHCTRAGLPLILLGAGCLFGCAGDRAGRASPDTRAAVGTDDTGGRYEWTGEGEPPWPVVHAVWRDVLASVHWAASRSGFAVQRVDAPGLETREYLLVDVRGREGRVTVTIDRFVEGTLPSDPWVSIEMTLGALGDQNAADALRADLLSRRPTHAR